MGLFKKDWFSKGLELSYEGKLEEAIECFDKALAQESKDMELSGIWAYKGETFNMLGRYDDAIRSFNKFLEYDSNCIIRHAYPHFMIAHAYALSSSGRYEETINCCDKILEVLADDPCDYGADRNYDVELEWGQKRGQVLHYKGFALENLKKYEEAMKCFDKALERIFLDEDDLAITFSSDDEKEEYEEYEEFALESIGILHEAIKKAVESDKKIIEENEIPDPLKIGGTPWWRFIIDFLSLLYGERHNKKSREKLLKYFDEFYRAPRISGSLVIEFEDFIKNDFGRKEEIMDIIEQWREFKLEEKL